MILWQRARPLTPCERRRRLALGLLMKAAISAVLLSAVIQPRPVLVYNPSPSVPIGFYRIDAPVDLKRGDLVLAQLPGAMRRLANQRRYVPATVPVLKAVAAVPGDEVCANADRIEINGGLIGIRKRFDHAGRLMPRWEGCRRLAPDELFLFNASSAHSFDGRYFGVLKRSAIIGKARPL